jgi:hypothetical protein
MQIPTIAAAVNGLLVLAVYLAAWEAPSLTMAVLEVGLAAGAAISTWYAIGAQPLKVRSAHPR